MKTVGIIAEYNPFHNGHLYQLTQAKALSGADYAVVILSGNFTQRGTPALLDKYVRCKMALLGGADLVLELPVCFATGSAEYFANGAVAILDSLGIDALCFGSECGDVKALKSAADILATEPDSYRLQLQKNLKSGMSFPAARSKALSDYDEEETGTAASDLLSFPNNILGVEYIKALLRRNSRMELYTITRKGAGYADAALSKQPFNSALAIRENILSGNGTKLLTDSMPSYALDILKEEVANGHTVSLDDFSSVLFYRLLSLKPEGYAAFADVTEALSDRIGNQLEQYSSFSQFAETQLKSKDVTLSRIERSLLHILLDIKKKDLTDFTALGNALYARILGFRETAMPLFGSLKERSTIPLISKLADTPVTLSGQAGPAALKMLSQDIFAAHLYDSVIAQKTGRPIQNEYRRSIIILPR